MPGPAPGGTSTFARLLAIGAAVTLMVAAIALVVRYQPPEPGPTYPPVHAPPASDRPIAAEADVFRVRRGDWSAPPEATPRGEAQPRTLAIYRTLRAYPGAPPRIPHGLTENEFRLGLCAGCHERGGFVPRFGGYAPVSPHPEYLDCLQCHAPDAMTVGIPLPGEPGGLSCGQCHVDPDRPPPSLVSLDWSPLAWPDRNQRALAGSPPQIPHDLHLRGNCLACHAGPGVVRELRTTHPERINCRQCHVPTASGEAEFSRPLDRPAPPAAGAR